MPPIASVMRRSGHTRSVYTPDMPIHYDLHVWAWEASPAGTFSQWNPNVEC